MLASSLSPFGNPNRPKRKHGVPVVYPVQEPNIRYLGLEVMSRLARLEGNDTAKKHQATVLMSLKVEK